MMFEDTVIMRTAVLILLISLARLVRSDSCQLISKYENDGSFNIYHQAFTAEQCNEYKIGSTRKIHTITIKALFFNFCQGFSAYNKNPPNIFIYNENRISILDFCTSYNRDSLSLTISVYTESLILRYSMPVMSLAFTEITYVSSSMNGVVTRPPPPTSTNSTNQLDCGIQFVAPITYKVVGGSVANANSWPWQAYLSNGCGGSLISNQYVLTAGHCVYNENKDNIRVYLGYQNINGNLLKNNYSTIEKITLHENYNPSNYKNDIALIKLSSPVKYSSVVQPICLPSSQLVTTNSAVIGTGWGATDILGRTYPDLLYQVKLPVRNLKDCGISSLDDSQLCAGTPSSSVSGIKDTCYGDSGGPLNYKYNDRYYAVGIVSFGDNSGTCNGNGAYTNVSYFKSWISLNMV